MKEETTEITIVAQDSLSLITKAEIDVQISTAKAFPRSIKMFLDKAMSIATISEEVAASCNYAVPRGGKAVTGPSIRLAEIVCSAYGNIRSGARVIANDGKTITAQGICHDLETNNCVTVEVKRKITDKYGKTFSEDMQVVTGNAACAIALRNAVFKVIPAALISDIYEQTKEVAKGKAETLPARRKKAVDFFIQNGVNEKQICEVLDVKKIDDIDLDKLSILRAMVSTVKNGEGTVKEMFEKEIESLKSKVINDEQ
jgi:D-alanine-D-alanine ligase-like ATP-grasp enzyme